MDVKKYMLLTCLFNLSITFKWKPKQREKPPFDLVDVFTPRTMNGVWCIQV